MVSLNESYSGNFADLAFIKVGGICIFVCIDPFRVSHKVISDIRVDDRNVFAADGGSINAAEFCNNLLNNLNGKLAGVVKVCSGIYCGFGSVFGNFGAIGYVGAALKNISCDGIKGCARLFAKKFGSFKNGVVKSGKLKNVGLGDEVTVLCNGCGDSGYSKALACGGNALGKRSKRFDKGSKLSEFNGLAAVFGDGAFLTELIVNKVCGSLVNKGHVIESLHFGGKPVKKSGLNFCKKLKVKNEISFHSKKSPLKNNFLREGDFFQILKSDFFSSLNSADNLRSVFFGEL